MSQQYQPNELIAKQPAADSTPDSTERKRAEQAWRQSEERLQLSLKAANMFTWEVDPKTGNTTYSANYNEVLGYTMSKSSAENFLTIHPDDEAYVLQAIDKALLEEAPLDVEHRIVNPQTNELIWVRAQGQLTSQNADTLPVFIGVTQNITVRKRAEEVQRESEEKFRTLFETIDEGFCLVELIDDERGEVADYRFVKVNPVFERQTGLAGAAGKRVMDIAPQTESYWLKRYETVARTGEPVRFDNYTVHNQRWYSVFATRVGSPGSRQVAIVFFNDITDRKRHEANLAFLAQTSADFAPLTSAEDIMQHVGERLARHLQLSRCNFSVVDPQADRIECLYDWRADDSLPSVLGSHHIATFLTESARRQYMEGKLSVVNDTHKSSMLNASVDLVEALGIRSAIDAPYLKDGRWEFLVTVARSEASEWRADEQELVRELAARIYQRIERARAEEALRESQERLRLALDASGMGTFLWYPQEDRTEPDARAFTLLGLGENDTITLAEALATSIHPDDREVYAAAVASAVDVNGDGKLDLDFRIVQPDGSLHWLHIYGHTFFSGENPTHAALMYGMFLDITEHKRHEANLAFLAEVSQDLVRLTTISETMNALGARIGGHFNVSRCAFFEFNETMDGAVCEYDWHRADVPNLAGSYRTADFYTDEFLQTMRAREAFVLRDRAADSRVDAMSLAALNIASLIVIPIVTDKQSLFVLCIDDTVPHDWHDDEIELMRELTTRIWARLERARIEEALLVSDRRKSEFPAMLAHELRNPMSTLHNTLLLLGITHGQDETLPLDRALGMMTREVTHLNRMIDDLLDVSRISQGKIQLSKERLDLGKLIREALEAARSQFASRGQVVTSHLPEEPIWVDGDLTRLTQVMRNLATNATKYTPNGGQIWVTLEKERGQAVVRIRDSGIGIAAEQLQAIFEVFVQVSASLDRPQGGLGLGLAVVKQLVELHGGYVGVHSPGLGQGSEFTVSLPSLPDGPPQLASAGAGAGRAREVGRILVVDDNADLALTTAMLLRHRKYEAHTCLSGPEALEAVESLQPAAILLDLGMPGMDGFDTCRRLRALEWGRHGVIVALSGYGQAEDKKQTKESGFDGHLVKPLNLQALTELLDELLNTNEFSK